jgi:hypothetical protein
MFLPTLQNQTTAEQKKLFLEPALKHQIIGCYAQTEVCSIVQAEANVDILADPFEFSLVTDPMCKDWRLPLHTSTRATSSNFTPLP